MEMMKMMIFILQKIQFIQILSNLKKLKKKVRYKKNIKFKNMITKLRMMINKQKKMKIKS